MNHTCPYCGASLHEGASFCPYCTHSVNRRTEVFPPRHMPRRAIYIALLIIFSAALVLALSRWRNSRPNVFDNGGTEVIYTAQGVDYQLCIAWADDPFTPANRERYNDGAIEENYRYPVLLYTNLADGETFAAETFLEQVDSITAEVSSLDEQLQMTCAQPVRNTDYVPNTAAIVYINCLITGLGRHSAELTISIHMKNGDVIRLHQTQVVDGYMTYHYTADDAPMDTAADLQALLARIARTTSAEEQVNIYLPPVTYTQPLELDGRPVNFIGSEDAAGNRTTFAAPVSITMHSGSLLAWENIDFAGPGSGTGLSLSARVHLWNCRIAGWETGVLAHTNAWINADDCVFEDNSVGLHFNAENGSPSDTGYAENVFRNNGTALLLERVPTDLSLKFPGSRFTGNTADIDNRCNQPLELSSTVFE